MHPILDSLSSSPSAWLRQLLLSYQAGDIESFERVVKSGEFLKNPLLVKSLPFLRQKLCLMTLVEAVFKRPKESREKMTFLEVSKETRVTLNEVEHLVMKALSLGLLRGTIDETESCIRVLLCNLDHLGSA
jgi:26S proteasome regulatory subunit N9